jgi:hypothetical protein
MTNRRKTDRSEETQDERVQRAAREALEALAYLEKVCSESNMHIGLAAAVADLAEPLVDFIHREIGTGGR